RRLRPATRRRRGAPVRSAERREPLRALTRDEHAQSLVDDGRLLRDPGEGLCAGDQFRVENHRRSHAYKYASSMRIRPAPRMTAPRYHVTMHRPTLADVYAARPRVARIV